MNKFREKIGSFFAQNLTVRGLLTLSAAPVLPATIPAIPLMTAIITVSTAELLALNATPKTLLAAPAAGIANIVERAEFFLDYNSAAYGGIATGEDLVVRYTGTSGAIALTCETTGFLDQTADQRRVCIPDNNVTPVAAAILVLHMTTGEITTGNSPLYVRVTYRPVTLLP